MRILRLFVLVGLCWGLLGCDQATQQFNQWFPKPTAGDHKVYQQTQIGTQLYRHKKYDRALKLFLSLQSKYPHRLDLMYNLGAVHLQLGIRASEKGTSPKKHFKQAKTYLTRVLTKGSAKLRQRAHYNLGILFTKKRLYEKALFHFEQSVYLASKTLKKRDKNAESNRDLLATLLRQRSRRRTKLNRTRVFRYEAKVIQLRASRAYKDPLRSISLRATFTHTKTHQKQIVWGYPISNRRWQVRFIPSRTGKWRYKIKTVKVKRAKGIVTKLDSSLRDEGLFRVMPSARAGRLIIATANHTKLAWKKPKTDLKLKKKKAKPGKKKPKNHPKRTKKKKKPALPKDETIIRWNGLGLPGLFQAKSLKKEAFLAHLKLLQQIAPTALHVPIYLDQLIQWPAKKGVTTLPPQLLGKQIHALASRLKLLRAYPTNRWAFVYTLRLKKMLTAKQMKVTLPYLIARFAHVDVVWSISELPSSLRKVAAALLRKFDPYQQLIAMPKLPAELLAKIQARQLKIQQIRLKRLKARAKKSNIAGPKRPEPKVKLPKAVQNKRYILHTSHHIATMNKQLQSSLYAPWIGDLPIPLKLSSKALLNLWWRLYVSGINTTVWLDRTFRHDEQKEVAEWLLKAETSGKLPPHPDKIKKKKTPKSKTKKAQKQPKKAPKQPKKTKKAQKQAKKTPKQTKKGKKKAKKQPKPTPIAKRISRPFIHYLIVRHRWIKFLNSFRFTGLVKPMKVRVQIPDFVSFRKALQAWQKKKVDKPRIKLKPKPGIKLKPKATSKPASPKTQKLVLPSKAVTPRPKMRWKTVGVRGYLAGNVTTILFLAPSKKAKKPPQIRWQKRRMDMEFSWFNARTGLFLKKKIFRQVTSLALAAPKKEAHIAKVVIKDHYIHTAYRIALPYRFAPVSPTSSWRAKDWQILVTPPKGPKQRLSVLLGKQGYFGQFRPDAPGFWRFTLLYKGKRLKGVWGYDGVVKTVPAQKPAPLLRHPRVPKRFLIGTPPRIKSVMLFATPIPKLLSQWSNEEFRTTVKQLPKQRPATNLLIANLPALPWAAFDAAQVLSKAGLGKAKKKAKAIPTSKQAVLKKPQLGIIKQAKNPAANTQNRLPLLQALTKLDSRIAAVHKSGRLLALMLNPAKWKKLKPHIRRARMMFLMDRFASAYPLLWIVDYRNPKLSPDGTLTRLIKQWYMVHYPHPMMLLRRQGKKASKAARKKASKVQPSAWPPLVGAALGSLRSEKRLKRAKGYDFLWIHSGNLTNDIKDFKLKKEVRPIILTWKPLLQKDFRWARKKGKKKAWNQKKMKLWARFLWRAQLMGFHHTDRSLQIPLYAASKGKKGKPVVAQKVSPAQRIPGVMQAFFGLFNWTHLRPPIRSIGLKDYQAFGAETAYKPKGKKKQHHAVIWVNQTVRKKLILKQKFRLKKHRYLWLDPLTGQRPVSPQLLPLPPKGKPNTLRVPFRPAVLYIYRRPPQRKKKQNKRKKQRKKKQSRKVSKRQQVRNKLKNLRENRNKMLKKMLGKPKQFSGKRG